MGISKKSIWTVLLNCIGIVTIGLILWNLTSKNDSEADIYYEYKIIRKEQRLTSSYYLYKVNKKVKHLIDSIAPTSKLNSLPLIETVSKYNIDLAFVLAQGIIESHFGTQGLARRSNSVWNVYARDGYSDEQIKKINGFYNHPDNSIVPYLELLTNKYLVDKPITALLENFVNVDGNRYASDDNYENKLSDKYIQIKNYLGSDYEYYVKFKKYE